MNGPADTEPISRTPNEAERRVRGGFVAAVVLILTLGAGVATAIWPSPAPDPQPIVLDDTMAPDAPETPERVSLEADFRPPRTGTSLKRIVVRNDGGTELDLTGWQLTDAISGNSYEIPQGHTLQPGESFHLDFSGSGGQTCLPPTRIYVHYCSALGMTRVSTGADAQLWTGGDLELYDQSGSLHTVWERWTS